MQRTFTLLLGVLMSVTSVFAEATGFTVETHATSEYGTTYRVYATFDDPTDWVSSVYGLTGGEGNVPMSLLANPGSSIFQANNGFGLNALFGQEVNPLFFPMAPDMQYDSWLTIGAENNAGDGGTQSAGMTAAIASFNAGTGFDNCGGAWFVASLSGSQPDWTAGDDLKVLLAQITMTDDANGDAGHFSFQFNIQYKTGTGPSQQFYGGLYNSADFIVDTDGCTDEGACNYSASALTDDGSCEYLTCAGCMDETACNFDADASIANAEDCEYTSCAGCTDSSACNFDAAATLSDDSCLIPDAASCEVCDGTAIAVADSDSDGICDSNEIVGCQDEAACNYDASATDAGSCDFADAACETCVEGVVILSDDDGDGICNADETTGCTDSSACNFSATATDDDGSCEFTSCLGCMDETACNYDAAATQDDGTCDLTSCQGCTDDAACNYDASATQDNGSCTFPDLYYDCDGNCLLDFDGDGICNELEIAGCMDELACNYDSTATDNAGCEYAPLSGDCDTQCDGDFDGDGYCDNLEIAGCTSTSATNYNAAATDEDGSCVWADPLIAGLSYDIVGHNTVGNATTYRLYAEFTSDLMEIQACYGSNVSAWSVSSTEPFYQNAFGALLGNTLNPLFYVTAPAMAYDSWFALGAGPGQAPGPQSAGLLAAANNFESNGGNFLVNDAVGASIFYTPGASAYAIPQDGRILLGQFTTEGVVSVSYNLQYRDGNNVTQQVTNLNLTFPANLPGCTDADACNYDAAAEFSMNDLCEYAAEFYDCDDVCLNDADGDGVCDELEVLGCTNSEACNFAADATDDDGSCVLPDQYYDCAGSCLNDADGDGVCDELETVGCQDDTACNYDETATDEGDCIFAEAHYDCDGNCLNDADGDGTCDELEIVGCQDDTACNYDASATDAGDCTFAEEHYDCAGACINDTDGDGVCDELEVVGCQDEAACNYDETATDAGDCTLAEAYYDCDGNCLNDADGDGTCDELEVDGCTDEAACNFNAEATEDDGTCEYPAAGYDCEGACLSDADGDGVCDEFEIPGCNDMEANNYDPAATDDDGSCVYGDCNDPLACNFVAFTEEPNNDMCEFPAPFFDCEGNCTGDYDGDGICEGEEVWGCTSNSADNFNAAATEDDGSCMWGAGLFEGLTYEVVTDHETGPIAGNGYVTYRLYAQFSTSDISLVQLFGNATNPWVIENTGDLYQDPVGGDFANNISPTLISYFPSVEFDSWLTIGALPGQFNAMNQTGMYAYLPAWNNGNAFNANNTYASISVTPTQSNQGVPDEDGRVLLAQITTNGVAHVQYNILFEPDAGESITFTDVELTFPTQIPGCTNPDATNYEANANSDDGSCAVEGCTDPDADNFDPIANVDNGSCLYTGCYDAEAYNFDAQANTGDQGELCDYLGCNDLEADNFDPQATINDGTCIYYGCMDLEADNYDPQANEDNASCLYTGCYDPEADNYDAQANTGNQTMLCDYYGCTDPDAMNFDPEANTNDGSCDYLGCTDSNADNFDPQATQDDGGCIYYGCMDPDADNYDADANTDDDSCLFTGCMDPEADNYDLFANTGDQEALCQYYGCMDAFADNYDSGANAGDQVTLCIYYGCTDETADNYDAGANTEDGTCEYFGCYDSNADNYDMGANAGDQEALCIYYGCINIEADNFDADANTDDGTCVFTGCMDPEADNYWELANAGAQADECIYYGCTNPDADNFDLQANSDDGTCVVEGCMYLDAANYNPDATYDNSQSCIFDTVGCTDPEAWNFMENAVADNGTCLYGGCTYDYAFNFDPDATVDDGSCEWYGCTDTSAVNFDADASHDDGSCELVGCMDPEGINYDADATFSGYCEYPEVCPGDINGDMSVDVNDLLTFFQYYGTLCN